MAKDCWSKKGSSHDDKNDRNDKQLCYKYDQIGQMGHIAKACNKTSEENGYKKERAMIAT